METAVIDRIIDGTLAVLLVGRDEREEVVPLASLPQGSQEGHWLKVELEGSSLIRAHLDLPKTDKATKRIAAKMDLLRRRGRR